MCRRSYKLTQIEKPQHLDCHVHELLIWASLISFFNNVW